MYLQYKPHFDCVGVEEMSRHPEDETSNWIAVSPESRNSSDDNIVSEEALFFVLKNISIQHSVAMIINHFFWFTGTPWK